MRLSMPARAHQEARRCDQSLSAFFLPCLVLFVALSVLLFAATSLWFFRDELARKQKNNDAPVGCFTGLELR